MEEIRLFAIGILIWLILCIVSTIICYFIYKWTFRLKFILLCTFFSGPCFIAGGILFTYKITPFVVCITSIVVGLTCFCSVEWLMRTLVKPINEINRCLISLSTGDFTEHVDMSTRDEFQKIFDKLNKMITDISFLISAIKTNTSENLEMADNLDGLSGELYEHAGSTSEKTNIVASSAEELNVSMSVVDTAMGEASQNIELVVLTVEQMTENIIRISENSEKARTVSNEIVAKTRHESKRVEELGSAARNINKVTEAISEISEQTNLLALNATIEAARAGDAGKGFAVVAGEIKELARQTAVATLEIKQIIEGIQQTAVNTISGIEEISSIIDEGNEVISAIASSVEEQSVSTQEIANNIGRASRGIKEISENISHSKLATNSITETISIVSKDSNEISIKSSGIKSNSEALSNLAAVLQDEMEEFTVSEQGR